MNAYATSSHASYRESAILTAPPEQLVVMLYDGCHRFLLQAIAAMRDGMPARRPANASAARRRSSTSCSARWTCRPARSPSAWPGSTSSAGAISPRACASATPRSSSRSTGCCAQLRDAWSQAAGTMAAVAAAA